MEVEISNVTLVANYSRRIGSYVSNCNEAADFIRNEIGSSLVERFLLLCMDYDYLPICYSIISIGNSDKVLVDLGELFRISLISGAKRLLVAHNHLGSSVEPTENDIKTTKAIGSVSKLLNLELIDSMVVAQDGQWLSIRKWVLEHAL